MSKRDWYISTPREITVGELREHLSKFSDDKKVIIAIDFNFNDLPQTMVADSFKGIYENFWGGMVIKGVNDNA